MQEYPYNSPVVLTDDIFVKYGGQTGTSTYAQRQASYLMAEEQVTEHLGAFVIPTVITGSATLINGRNFMLDYGHLKNIILVHMQTIQNVNPLTTKMYTGTALIVEPQYGYISIYEPSMYGVLKSVSVVYESGLATGTYSSPVILSALTMAAQINLNEMDVSLSNESTADIGVQQFSNQSYSEMRVKLGVNSFGNSAAAQRVSRLLKKYRSRPSIGFH